MPSCVTSEDYHQLALKLDAHTDDLVALSLSPAVAEALKTETPNALLHNTNFLSVELLVGRMAVVLVWAIIDEAGFRLNNNPHITDEERIRLLAWRHVRDSATHCSGHRRSTHHRAHFEEVMNGPKPFSTIVRWDDDIAVVDSSAGLKLSSDMSQILLDIQKRLLAAEVAS
jgi:hypothetical protein